MTNEEVERAIEFLLDHHAKVSADIERHSEQIAQLTQTVSSLTDSVQAMQQEMDTDRRETREVLNSVITEMRDSFDKLILANEVTRDFANKIASLEVQTSQRVTGLERRVDDLEQKQE